ncbi:glycosyltransferase family 39 protein [Mycobacterium sp. OTB74]|uniref:ArnT family glycosyltransferase n=1 Tax=Mycobacterium sp. OTB74 TaxID=1853452 RepID=UPI002475F328|nr:glycosyltransferase family 39 protein [Mycobacterium sp. OTB74]MDH6244257.1 4-amino-4-deoxy-L-arabinose transferase-like glycosyltransferase [Mycobacterium sp. OTB74]
MSIQLEASDELADESVPEPVARGQRLALAVLLIGTAVLYLWNITVNAMGNDFYAAAAWAGSRNWEALLFGSLDPANFITVDKPPLSQWVMGLSGQIFGFSSASMLVPEALMAVGSVALLYATVKRVAGPWTGLLAGAALALTPVCVLMFRFNNPDAAMVLLMTAGAYCGVRALQGTTADAARRSGARWMALAGVAMGFAFLAKMLEGIMVAPSIALAYLVAAQVSWRQRLVHLGWAMLGTLAASGWFVVVTLLWPASSRPYLAGSTDNNFMNLVLGYNGFGRLTGDNKKNFAQPTGEIGTLAGTQLRIGPHGPLGSHADGPMRLVSGEFGYEVGWLLPAALVSIIVVLIARHGKPRTDLVRAAVLMFGVWLLSDGLVLSYMKGFIHAYYSMSIAPAVAAMFAIGVQQMWVLRGKLWARIVLAVMLFGTAVWSFYLLNSHPDWLPALRWIILVGAGVGAVVLVRLGGEAARVRAATAAFGVALGAAVLGSAAYSVATINVSHVGGGPTVGPSSNYNSWATGVDNADLDDMLRATPNEWSAAIERSSYAATLELHTGTSVMAIGGFGGGDPAPTLKEFQDYVAAHRIGYFLKPGLHGRGPQFGRHDHNDIVEWVQANFRATKVGDVTVYDLSVPKS